jgi:hypothetical protein
MADKEKPVCTDCGGDNVSADAWSRWDIEKQQWELSQTFDDTFCHDCEGSCKVNWVKEEA